MRPNTKRYFRLQQASTPHRLRSPAIQAHPVAALQAERQRAQRALGPWTFRANSSSLPFSPTSGLGGPTACKIHAASRGGNLPLKFQLFAPPAKEARSDSPRTLFLRGYPHAIGATPAVTHPPGPRQRPGDSRHPLARPDRHPPRLDTTPNNTPAEVEAHQHRPSPRRNRGQHVQQRPQ